ncbi:hypothetical protein TRFO_31857 [Tritrichomonas foetus]|uniref:DOCKER domain-containing protein n=1 Tax=Tritrichomonas foetus TaxID=1144522 RepID=A0A1J4JUW4_9EUKA|nr:hypothetical protein TRFO_31857 [Tritrichomonas foetus]|eukprot:OHT01318.1 hypothetical protein TRFO_31857 [Tritrichomonas foetus]
MKNLFVTFEIQRYVSFNENKLSSSSYTTIPLSSTVGNIHNVNNAMAPLHHFQFKNRPNLPSPEEFMFPPQGYDAGCIDYSLNISSTKFTSFDPLYKLIHFTEFPDEIASSLMNFMQLGLSEISKFIKEIAASLCLIMVAKKEFCKEAFKKLTNVFAEVLTRGRSEYIDQLDLFVDTFLSETRPMNEFDLNNLSKLYEQLLPNIISMISTDDTTQDFRNIIKCSPYFLKMSSMSIVLQRKIHPNLVNWKSIIGKIVILFTKLTEIISEVPSEEVGIQRKGLVFTNQQLILFHFSKMISAILICIQPEIVANIVINFITSIRYVIKDRKQITIDKSKLRILKSLALTQLWTSSQSRAMMEQIYQSELVKASTLPHCIPFIVPILSSLYLTVRNSFIVKFSSLLVKCYRSEMEIVNNSSSPAAISTSKMNILNMTKLLLLIANTFYVNFPIKEMLDLINIDLIGPKDRPFAFINFLHVRQDILVQPNIPEDEKIRIIKSFLDLSIHARTEKCSHLDRLLYSCIYPKLIDYQIRKKVFFSLSTTSQASPILIRPLLHCFMNDKSTDLKLIFMRIVQASDENVELDLLNETLVAAYELSHYPNFFFLVEFFENIESFRNLDQKSFSFFIQFKYIISALNDIAVFSDNKDVLIQNSENLTDAINTVIKICKDAGSESILSKLILEQTQLHLSAENYLEAANSYMSLIDHIPCNHEPVEKMFQIDEALTGIEVHINVMLKCIDLYTKASYEELGLEVIKRLKNEVIRKFKYFELMKKVNEKEAELLQRISSEERNFSNFFYVRFFGDIPNEHYQKNKMFIYRRSDKVNLKAMIMELSHKFPKCKIDFKPPKDENATYIQVIPVSISWEEEVENPFSRQKINLNARKYIIKYQIFKKVNVFRAERFLSIGQEPQSQQQHQLLQRRNTYRSKIKNPGTHFPQALEQVFLFTKQSFPGIATRFEIDQSKTVVRVLSPIDSAILLVRRRSLKLMIDIQHIKKLFDSGSKYLDLIEQDGCFNLFEQGMSKVVDDLASGQILWFVETFIKGRISSPAIVNNNPKKITALKDTIKELLTIVYNGINVDESIQGEEGKANIQRIERIFQNSRKLIEPYL